MKFRFPLLLPLLALLFVTCKKDDDPGDGFDMQFRQEFIIPAGLGVFSVHHFYMRNIPSRYAQLLADNNKADADITSIIPTKIELSGIFGDASFDYIEEVSARVFLESDPNDWLEFAYRLPVPLDPGNNLPLIPNGSSVKEYLSQQRYSIDLSIRLRKTTPEETSARLDVIFRAFY